MSANQTEPPQRHYSLLGALLSYLVPGLGQIYQGRIAKGLLFFVCLYTMFFLGMYLGNWSNVYLLDEGRSVDATGRVSTRLPRIILLRWQSTSPEKTQFSELRGALAGVGHRPQFAGQFWIGVAAWPALWQYYHYNERHTTGPIFGDFQREPRNDDLNTLQKNSNKVWDLAWVYTVIAGVLNVLVIYDAFAGPAFITAAAAKQETFAEGVAA